MKNYFTDFELATEALHRAQNDPLWEKLTQETPIDYIGGACSETKKNPEVIRHCGFNAIPYATFGSCEGIYAHVHMFPDPRPSTSAREGLVVIKTLSGSKEDYLRMQTLAGLIAYHVGQVIDENLSRFD